ncbi:hypothetical protein ACN47E_003168 [Coniothyrium glycines]
MLQQAAYTRKKKMNVDASTAPHIFQPAPMYTPPMSDSDLSRAAVRLGSKAVCVGRQGPAAETGLSIVSVKVVVANMFTVVVEVAVSVTIMGVMLTVTNSVSRKSVTVVVEGWHHPVGTASCVKHWMNHEEH